MRRLFDRFDGQTVPIRCTIGASDVVKTARSALKKAPTREVCRGLPSVINPDYNNPLTRGLAR